MKISQRYLQALALAFAAMLAWPTLYADGDCQVGCQGEPYEESGREDTYDLFMDKPADDFRYSDKEKRVERDSAIGRDRGTKEERRAKRESRRADRYSQEEEIQEPTYNKRESKKEERRRKREERRNKNKDKKPAKREPREEKPARRKQPVKESRKEPRKEKAEKVEKPRKEREKAKPKEGKKPAVKAIVAEDIERNKDVLEGIYAGITGFERLKEGEHEDIVARGGFPTYGEITYDSWQAILDDLAQERGIFPTDEFMDFGCGVGKVAIQTYLNTPIRRARGVDLAETRLKRAKQVKDKLDEMGLLEKGRELGFDHGSMLEIKTKGLTIGYTCSTCFSHELMHALMEMLSKLKKGF
ncbi:MAG TPA: hypothetical protein VLG71_02985, partial [Candidatus Limnocylindria bacterium]|nr:hypothetical protein [Candidatus Limnocylindria bacterium]